MEAMDFHTSCVRVKETEETVRKLDAHSQYTAWRHNTEHFGPVVERSAFSGAYKNFAIGAGASRELTPIPQMFQTVKFFHIQMKSDSELRHCANCLIAFSYTQMTLTFWAINIEVSKDWPLLCAPKMQMFANNLAKFAKSRKCIIIMYNCIIIMYNCDANVQLLKNTIPILPFRENVVRMGAGVSRPRKVIKVIIIATRVDIGVITVIVMQMKTPRGWRRLLKDGTASRTQCRAMPEERKKSRSQAKATVSQLHKGHTHPHPPHFLVCTFSFYLQCTTCSKAFSILHHSELHFNLQHAGGWGWGGGGGAEERGGEGGLLFGFLLSFFKIVFSSSFLFVVFVCLYVCWLVGWWWVVVVWGWVAWVILCVKNAT